MRRQHQQSATKWSKWSAVFGSLVLGGAFGQVAHAATFFVGTCKTGKSDFPTIQAALTAVPAGSIINVCPGTYPEQLTISHPITLQGIQSGNNAQVIIKAPANGALAPVNSAAGQVSAQIAVINSGGLVNLSGLTVDGSGLSPAGSGVVVAAIFFNSSPALLRRIAVQNQPQPSNGNLMAFLVYDDNAVSPAVSIVDSVVSFPSTSSNAQGATIGLYADTNLGTFSAPVLSGGTIALTLTNDLISGAREGLEIGNAVAATISGSVLEGSNVSATSTGIFSFNSGALKINNSSVLNYFDGILLEIGSSSISLTNNYVISTDIGINVFNQTGATTITGNRLVQSMLTYAVPGTGSGLDLGCNTPLPTVSGNTFVGSPIALNNVPVGLSAQTSAGTYINVPVVEQLCTLF